MSQRDTIIHLVAGGVAGTVAAIVTCPLEVVKTRLQSSQGGFYVPPPSVKKEQASGHVTCKSLPSHRKRLCITDAKSLRSFRYPLVTLSHCASASPPPGGHPPTMTPGIMQCLRLIVEREGPRALFKGLIPNIIGVAPSRAIYFCTYSQSKNFFNTCLPPDSPSVHMCAASCAGFVSCTATNPIWFVKTRLQLNHHTHSSAVECIKSIYQQSGILGFYKGIVASYFGISETVVHFVIYEAIKAWLISHRAHTPGSDDTAKSSRDFVEFMGAGALSKTIASCIAYPHEVVRTRLREEGDKYRGFWQSLNTIVNEEGSRGLYRGLATQLVRQIPNTAIMMATYEAVVYILTNQFAVIPKNNGNSNTMHTTSEFHTESETKRELA